MSGEKVSSFRERFAELVSSCGKSQSSIAAEFGVAKQTISAWITGQTSPRAPVLSALAEHFGVNLAWLMGYDVPRNANKEKEIRYDKAVFEYVNFSEEENQLLSVYRSLGTEGRQYLLQQASIASAMFGKKDPSVSGEKSG